MLERWRTLCASLVSLLRIQRLFCAQRTFPGYYSRDEILLARQSIWALKRIAFTKQN